MLGILCFLALAHSADAADASGTLHLSSSGLGQRAAAAVRFSVDSCLVEDVTGMGSGLYHVVSHFRIL